MKNVSKKIKQCIRDKKKSQRQEKTQQIVEEFNGIKSISKINSARKKTLTPKLRDEKDEVITFRKGIANTFAKFYSKLYAKEKQDEEESIEDKEKMSDHTKLKVNEELVKKANENTEDETDNERPKDERERNKNYRQPLTASKKKKKTGDNKGIKAEDTTGLAALPETCEMQSGGVPVDALLRALSLFALRRPCPQLLVDCR